MFSESVIYIWPDIKDGLRSINAEAFLPRGIVTNINDINQEVAVQVLNRNLEYIVFENQVIYI